MKSNLIRNTLFIVISLGLFGASAAFAHEPPVIGGDCSVEVGWLTEPALEDADNATVLIIEDCGGAPVAAEDINIKVTVLKLNAEAYNATVSAKKHLGALNTIENFGSKQITPSQNGAYGFVLNGTIAGRVIDNVKFVCGAGSQHPTEKFDCVEDPVVFPGPAIKRYVPN